MSEEGCLLDVPAFDPIKAVQIGQSAGDAEQLTEGSGRACLASQGCV